MACQIAAIPMTLGHAPNAVLLECDFAHSCAAVVKITSGIAHHVVAEPLVNYRYKYCQCILRLVY